MMFNFFKKKKAEEKKPIPQRQYKSVEAIINPHYSSNNWGETNDDFDYFNTPTHYPHVDTGSNLTVSSNDYGGGDFGGGGAGSSWSDSPSSDSGSSSDSSSCDSGGSCD